MPGPPPIELRTEALSDLDPRDTAEAIRALFLEAGLLSTLPDDTPVGSPLADLRRARDQLFTLLRYEEELREASAPVGGFGTQAPWWTWFVVPAVFLVTWRVSACGDGVEQEQLAFAHGLSVAAVFALLCLGYIGKLELRARKHRAERVAELEEQIRDARRELVPFARTALSRSYVARVGPRLVVSTPHLTWLHASADAALRGARGRERAEGALSELVRELEAEAKAAERALRALLNEPPEHWSDRGLAPELAGYRARLTELGVAVEPLCAVLDEAWDPQV